MAWRWIHIGFAAIPSLLLLGALEAGFRAIEVNYHPHDPGMESRFAEGCYQPSLTRGYEPIPNTCGRNELGMYSGDHPIEKGDGVFRILVLGDSIADQRLWVDTLEASLQESMPDKHIEVFNSGVGGYDTCSELRVLEEKGLEIDADLILLQFCLNDFTVAHSVAMPLPNGDTRLFVGDQFFDLPSLILSSRLATWAAINHSLIQGKTDHSHTREADYIYTRQCLTGIQGHAAELEIPFIPIVFPPLISGPPSASDALLFPWGYAQGEADATALMAEVGADALYLRPILEFEGTLETFRHDPRDPWHPDVKGQRIIGKALAEALRPAIH